MPEAIPSSLFRRPLSRNLSTRGKWEQDGRERARSRGQGKEGRITQICTKRATAKKGQCCSRRLGNQFVLSAVLRKLESSITVLIISHDPMKVDSPTREYDMNI